MKHIFLNLKRFDIPKQMGGVNSIAAVSYTHLIFELFDQDTYAYLR